MDSLTDSGTKADVHLLVDFENLKPSAADLALIRSREYRLWVFHGPHQNKFDAALVKAWQPLGDRVDFVQSSKQGKNALDFHIAFKLGELCLRERTSGQRASYVVVSGDGGFEPLFDHMRALACTVALVGSIPEALKIRAPVSPVARVTAAPPRDSMADGHAATVIAALRARPGNRPADRTALERYIVSRLRNKIAPSVAASVIRELELQEVVSFNGRKVAYRIPKAKKQGEGPGDP
jgi:hypothetical protein